MLGVPTCGDDPRGSAPNVRTQRRANERLLAVTWGQECPPRGIEGFARADLDRRRSPAHSPAVIATLAELGVGRRGTVSAVEGGDSISVRLLEMGFVPGTSVKVVKAAPLGDPLEIQLRGYHISLRRLEAQRIALRTSYGVP